MAKTEKPTLSEFIENVGTPVSVDYISQVYGIAPEVIRRQLDELGIKPLTIQDQECMVREAGRLKSLLLFENDNFAGQFSETGLACIRRRCELDDMTPYFGKVATAEDILRRGLDPGYRKTVNLLLAHRDIDPVSKK